LKIGATPQRLDGGEAETYQRETLMKTKYDRALERERQRERDRERPNIVRPIRPADFDGDYLLPRALRRRLSVAG
jgi:hypothetical protein